MHKEESGDDIKEYSDEDVKKILKEALRSRLNESETQLPNRREVYKALSSYMSEFLSCYQLIGYDLNGKPLNMKYYTNNLEESALEHAFIEEIAQHMNG